MLCVSHDGKSPVLKPGSFTAPNATAVGDVRLEKDASLWYGAVARGDDNFIQIGEGSNVQDNAVIHTSEETPAVIGKKVTVGHGAILHGCTVGDLALIGMGAILLDGCVIGEKCIVGAGALVTGGTVIPPCSLVIGSPAKVKRPLTEKELESLETNCEVYVEHAREQLECTP